MNVLSSCRNETIDEAARTRGGREFQARAAATGNARSPIDCLIFIHCNVRVSEVVK